MKSKINCDCTGDILCSQAKKLWNQSSFKNRSLYSIHRCLALGLDPRYNSFRSLNTDSEGKKLKLK